MQRQRWLVQTDGKRVNSAAGTKRGMPPYLLIMDLAFSALFILCSEVLYLGLDGVWRFFMLFLPLFWHWAVIVARLNMCDAEDICSDVYVLLIMVCGVSAAISLPDCFCSIDRNRHTVNSMPLCSMQSTAENNLPTSVDHTCESEFHVGQGISGCTGFAMSYVAMRLVSSCMVLRMGVHVVHARALVRRDAVAWLFNLPLLYFLARGKLGTTGAEVYNGVLLFVSGVADLLTQALPSLLTLCRVTLPPSFESRIPLNVPHLEARYERMLTISLGNLISTTITDVRSTTPHFDGRSIRAALAVPLVAMLIKIFYFDLSPQFGGSGSSSGSGALHALHASAFRGAVWAMLQGPLQAILRWLAVASMVQVAPKHVGRASQSNTDARWSLVSASVCFMLVITALHATHKGEGHPNRKMSKTARFAMRGIWILIMLIVGATVSTCVREPMFWLVVGSMYALAALELWGRGFSWRQEQIA